jgi:hypothetical protein
MNHRVCDTPLRTVLIVTTANGIELLVDFFLFNLILHQPEKSLGLAILAQIVCYSCTCLSLRIWNKISFGRKVTDVTK